MTDLQKLYAKINWNLMLCDFWLLGARCFSFAVDQAEKAHLRSIELIRQIPEDKCSSSMKVQLRELRGNGLI